MTLNMTQAIMRYDALGRLTAIEVGALAGFVYGYVPINIGENLRGQTRTAVPFVSDPFMTLFP